MKREQIDHISYRIHTICSEKTTKAYDKVAEAAKRVVNYRKLRIKKGAFSIDVEKMVKEIKKSDGEFGYLRVDQFVTLDKDPIYKKLQDDEHTIVQKYNRENEKLQAKKRELLDRVILGDAKEALELLRQFEQE